MKEEFSCFAREIANFPKNRKIAENLSWKFIRMKYFKPLSRARIRGNLEKCEFIGSIWFSQQISELRDWKTQKKFCYFLKTTWSIRPKIRARFVESSRHWIHILCVPLFLFWISLSQFLLRQTKSAILEAKVSQTSTKLHTNIFTCQWGSERVLKEKKNRKADDSKRKFPLKCASYVVCTEKKLSTV